MQINEATLEQRWNWKTNLARGEAILAEKRAAATAYLDQHPPYTPEMLQKEMIQRYNGKVYHKWDPTNVVWVESPPAGNGYVALILGLLAERPWLTLLVSPPQPS
jgi:hypothetical protein